MKIECNFISSLRRYFSFMSKGFLAMACFASLLGLVQEARAYTLNPDRCTADDIGDDKVAAGRNAWFKRCEPGAYKFVFSEGSEFRMNKVNYERRVYVTYGVPDPENKGGFLYPGDLKAPTNANAPCSSLPAEWQLIGVCVTGCYAPGQELLFSDGWAKVEDAASIKTQKRDLVTLGNDSTLEQLSTRLSQIKNWIFDLRDAQQELLEFKLTSGGTLVVTTGHPILDHEGRMREASTFKVGDLLVKSDGSFDPIESIVGKTYFGKVYNVNLESDQDLENIVIAQGYLNGSLHFQAGVGVKKLNQALFRKLNIPSALIQN